MYSPFSCYRSCYQALRQLSLQTSPSSRQEPEYCQNYVPYISNSLNLLSTSLVLTLSKTLYNHRHSRLEEEAIHSKESLWDVDQTKGAVAKSYRASYLKIQHSGGWPCDYSNQHLDHLSSVSLGWVQAHVIDYGAADYDHSRLRV